MGGGDTVTANMEKCKHKLVAPTQQLILSCNMYLGSPPVSITEGVLKDGLTVAFFVIFPKWKSIRAHACEPLCSHSTQQADMAATTTTACVVC